MDGGLQAPATASVNDADFRRVREQCTVEELIEGFDRFDDRLAVEVERLRDGVSLINPDRDRVQWHGTGRFPRRPCANDSLELTSGNLEGMALDLHQVAIAVADFDHDALAERRHVHGIAWTERHRLILRQVDRGLVVLVRLWRLPC